jgi:UDP-N-acetylglucosamine--N-acetylmuramyl-(pentapeptide) pyrophosphoryl-undecaprenol N-acetylglucosamine transferase
MTTLLVASTGGHLKQLHRLHSRLTHLDGPIRWATFDTAQSRSLLASSDVDFVPFVGGRDPRAVARNLPIARRILRDHDVSQVVSTGSAVALPFFAAARMRGLDAHYIESAARSTGPSTTGRLMSRVPGVHLYCQYPVWAQGRWAYSGSVFDSFLPAPAGPARSLDRVVVSLGTYRGYGFRRLLERLLVLLPPETEVLWQTGDTDIQGLPIEGHVEIPERDLVQAIGEADLLIAHAGVGTALAALEAGRCPMLVPRRLHHGEHVDDHQTQIAQELSRRDLVVTADADDLTLEALIDAASRRVATLEQDPPFELRATSPRTAARAAEPVGTAAGAPR